MDQHLPGQSDIAQHQILGDLDRERRRREAPRGQGFVDPGRKIRDHHRRREQIDRHRHLDPLGPPGTDVVQRQAEHEIGHRTGQAVPADQGQKFVRAEQAAVGVGPPQQRLQTHDLAGLQIELGLIDQGQFPLVDGAAQLTEQLHNLYAPRRPTAYPCRHRGAGTGHLLGVGPRLGGVSTFGGVHRQIGSAQQFLGGNARVARAHHGEPDARLHQQVVALHPDRLVEGLDDAVGDRLQRRDLGFDDDSELVTTQTGDGVPVAHAGHDALTGRPEQIIAGSVPQGVVDQLEIVEVDHEHPQRRPPGVVPTVGAPQAVGEQGAVGQPGQRIPQRLVGDGGEQPPVLGHDQVLAQ